MKRIIHVLALFILTSSLSCKKLIEDKKRDAVLDAMTNGVWIVEQYFENIDNITGEFLNYEFRFFRDGTVKSDTLGTNVASGTWEANVDDYTITSAFPAATNPVARLNFTWLIKDTEWDYVLAETTTPDGKNVLHLRKKS